jgi:hypothetical protein
MSRWEFCFVRPGADVPTCDKDWKELYKGNVQNIEVRDCEFMHVVPPTYLYPVKYNLTRSFEHNGKVHRYYEHIYYKYPPFFCRQLVPTLVLNLEVDARGKMLTVKVWQALTGDCILVMQLPKCTRWTMSLIEKEAKKRFARADRYTQLTPMRWLFPNYPIYIRGTTVIWNPKWKLFKPKWRVMVKTPMDQLKITHFWSRVQLAEAN